MALVLGRGRVVSSDALVDAAWPDAKPAQPQPALQASISHLRRRSDPDGAPGLRTAIIARVESGYARPGPSTPGGSNRWSPTPDTATAAALSSRCTGHNGGPTRWPDALDQEIAQALFITPPTVRQTLETVHRRLGVTSAQQLRMASSAR